MNFDQIVKRIMSYKGYEDEKEVAKLFDLSGPDFSQRKKRGSILSFIVSWGINEKVNLDWLILGKKITPVVAEPAVQYAALFLGNNDLKEIVDILENDVPEYKDGILKLLRAKKELKNALKEMSLKESEWF